jgi:hypothetical protein
VLVRAKKDFETEDVENMIAYFETVRGKVDKEWEGQAVKGKKNDNKVRE